MKTIKVLSEGLIDRIAAGEVIENPASVIKELLENSLDASASNLEISVAGGGKEEILIVDDGEGIPKDQVEVAFMRHATSKIRSFEDLLRTGTMGFRGEALPSISSVSIMELSTCADGENSGTRIRFEGGKQTYLGPAPLRKGCSISVRNLFYNVPARRKFLRSDSSEKRKIAEVVRRYLIARPDVAFKVVYDGRTGGSFPATGDLRERLARIWGNNVAEKLLAVEKEPVGPVRVTGFISTPDLSRANRTEIFFFVNMRPVLERAMFGAISAAYEGSLHKGQFPYAAVFLEIDPGFVDINVHPAKTEVRFSDSGFIFANLKDALRSALRLPIGLRVRTLSHDESSSKVLSFNTAKEGFFDSVLKENSFPSQTGRSHPITADRIGRELEDSDIDHPFQVFKTYIIAGRGDRVIIMDQHTAHERILFEKTLKAINRQASFSQKLLFEARVKLTPEEFALVEELSEILARAGFEIRPFGESEVILSGIPQEYSALSPERILKELLSAFVTYRNSGGETKSALAAAVACRAAIKAGHVLTDPQMRGLYSNLMKCDEPFRCPHGRPTMAMLDRDDLEKIFQRK